MAQSLDIEHILDLKMPATTLAPATASTPAKSNIRIKTS